MALLNKNRKSSISEKGLARYLVYAVGEIILVVIGILIAVSINDWQENKKEEKLLKTYLKDYRNDLLVDSTMVGINLRMLEQRDEGFKMVMSDTLKREDLFENPITFNLITTYNPVKLQSKGYNELLSYVGKNETKKDSLIQNIIASHSAYNELLEMAMKNISEDIADNMRYLKNNKPWIGRLMTGKLDEEITDYFLSIDYQNRSAVHATLVFGNLQVFLKQYKAYIEEVLPKIEERIN
ncbi:MAG: DUF6090 family protein [Bacteroidota bacterium]